MKRKSNNFIVRIKAHVEEACASQKGSSFGDSDFSHHIVPVVKYAKELAKLTGADEEIVEISAWLHDIGRLKGDPEIHEKIGAEYAEKYLKELGCPAEKIAKIKYCILMHRGSSQGKRETLEAQCVASADAMAHFDFINGLFFVALVVKKKDLDSAKEWVKSKLQRSWNKLMPEAQKIIKPKYEAAMMLLE
ncbi:HD domain-containing protein [Candidatus Woesearchaeota archaeon]|nr:HD domain-containing protein [Candidatus Woesearchaeota archaeon]